MRAAVCGLGRMGAAFAAALAARGHAVTAWNRTPRKARGDLTGVRLAGNPAEAARNAEAVVVAVFDGPAAASVLLGPDGIAAGAAPGTLVVNATTLAPEESRALAAEAVAAGLRYLEAPVLGSVPAVRAGTLRVLTGGAEQDAREAEPVLRAWTHAGSRRHTGPVGSATALKLVANLGLGLAVAALHDSVRLGEALGLARADVLDALEGGAFGGLVARKRSRLREDAYGEADFTVAALAKDLALATAATSSALGDAATGLLTRAARTDGSLDVAALGRSG
ncbi:NAD(P)-dependent oxidoreductase [Streptomyces sp. NPDC003717]|uniref:NAD(P)-dependent oxidoreductase n=1 Tax=Streptomyces sp. NPDC003717 TaxID=3154276 RepID=UPI0033B239AD